MDLYRTARRLQMALCQRGRRVKINQVQYFSRLTGRPATMYVVTETEKLDTGKIKNTEICKSTRIADVVTAMAALLKDTQREMEEETE